MAQLENTTRRATTLAPGMVALVAAVVIAVAILLVMLVPSRVSPPTTGSGEQISPANPALIEAGREWQRQRELEGGFTDPLTQAARDWEQQRKQQSPFGGE